MSPGNPLQSPTGFCFLRHHPLPLAKDLKTQVPESGILDMTWPKQAASYKTALLWLSSRLRRLETTHTAGSMPYLCANCMPCAPQRRPCPTVISSLSFYSLFAYFMANLTWRLCFHFALSIHWLPQMACGSQHLHHMHWES